MAEFDRILRSLREEEKQAREPTSATSATRQQPVRAAVNVQQPPPQSSTSVSAAAGNSLLAVNAQPPPQPSISVSAASNSLSSRPMLQSQHNLPPPPAAPQSGRAAAFSQQDQQQDQEPPVSGSTPAGNSSLRSSFSAITPSTPRVTFNPVNKIQYFTPASSASSSDLSSASPALSSASSSASSASSSASSGSSQQGPVNLGYGLYIDPDKEGVFSGVNTSSESVRHHGFRRPASVPSLSPSGLSPRGRVFSPFASHGSAAAIGSTRKQHQQQQQDPYSDFKMNIANKNE